MISATLRSYSLYKEEITDYGKSYIGPAEECTASWSTGPEQVDVFGSWVNNYFIGHLKAKLQEKGARLIKVSVYRDKAPIFSTKWRCVATADVSGGQMEFRLAFVWFAVIAGALALFSYFFIKPTIDSIRKLFWGSGGGGLGGLLTNPLVLIMGGVLLLAWQPWKKEA